MAEYIDVPNLMLFLKCGEYESSEDIIKFVENNATTDVIEYVEYIKSQKEVLRLGDLFHKANQNAMKYERECRELHSKIDIAIKEMEKYGNGFDDIGKHNLGSTVENCIEIIKRNIKIGVKAMAEYIDRNLIEWYGCNFEDAECENRNCSGCSHAKCSHSQVMQITTADVIEREKVKSLIEVAIEDGWELDYTLERLKGI